MSNPHHVLIDGVPRGMYPSLPHAIAEARRALSRVGAGALVSVNRLGRTVWGPFEAP